MTIRVVLQVKNAQHTITAAVQSAFLLTDKVTVMDMASTDDTRKRAKDAGATVVGVPVFPYVEPVRHLAFTRTTEDWIFLLDDDERITKELAEEIKETISNTRHTHFKIPRKNIFAGRMWLKHGGWWKDYQTRLIRRASLVSWDSRIHSTPQIHGTLGYLKTPFEHYFHPNLENMVEKTRIYEAIEADLLYKAGRNVNTATFFRKYLGELYRRLIRKQGYLDGTLGVIESLYQSYSKTITWLFLYEKRRIMK